MSHIHVSEREIAHTWPDGQKDDARWEDCTWCSLVMFLHDLGYDFVPPTHAEAERLRDAAGVKPTGASAAWQNLLGVKRRYPQIIQPIHAVDNRHFNLLWAALTPGTSAVVQGSMGVMSAHWRRHDPGFGGTHAAEATRRDDSDRVWWDDPLGPTTGYAGEWMSKADLQRFVQGFPGGVSYYAKNISLPASSTAGGPADDMLGFTLVPGRGRGTVKVKPVSGHPNSHAILDLSTGQYVPVDDGVERVAYGFGALDKALGANTDARKEGYLITLPGSLPGKPAWLLAVDVVFTPLAAPQPAPVDCKPQIDAAVAAAKAPLQDQIARISAITKET